MTRTVFRSDDIACGGCTASIEKALMAVAGVSSVAGDPQTKVVVVDHDDSVSDEKILQVVEELGFATSRVG